MSGTKPISFQGFSLHCLVVVLALGVPEPASAENGDAVYLARSFVGHCVQNAGRVDKVSAAARVAGWKEVQGDMKAMLAPQDPSAEYSGWLVLEEGKTPFLLGISKADLNGMDYSICVVANPNIEVDEVLTEIRNLASIGKIIDSVEEAGQRYRVWSTEKIAEQSFISAVDAPKMDIRGGTISLSAPTEE
ncbi:hypothetical protein [Maritimibacter sp. 55A14]|uniref:hypothetical protein n=1 Tax=Maritimibacter sp. 55A14 TaxID=2174844 RepID=UPI0011B236FC|nr:hypothetical protein [Maritimibacter sp. 55A14]